MSNDTEVAALERGIERAKDACELGECLTRLRLNRDFKRVISDGYFREEAIRLVHLKGDANMQTPERQASIVAQIDAIGQLVGYFVKVAQQADLGERKIEADQATLEEMAAEELQ